MSIGELHSIAKGQNLTALDIVIDACVKKSAEVGITFKAHLVWQDIDNSGVVPRFVANEAYIVAQEA